MIGTSTACAVKPIANQFSNLAVRTMNPPDVYRRRLMCNIKYPCRPASIRVRVLLGFLRRIRSIQVVF